MNRIRTRLLLVFLVATLVPVGATLAVTWRLLELEHNLRKTPVRELDQTSRSLLLTGRALYQSTCNTLRAEARADGECRLAGENQDRVEYQLGSGRTLTRPIPSMKELRDHYTQARSTVVAADSRDWRRGFTITLAVLAASAWIVCVAVVLYLARRISVPMEQLTEGLRRLADGDLSARLQPGNLDEIGTAMLAFNRTAQELEESRDKLVHVTRLSSWQTLARKMAHEVKNSLTPIRLTMEEIVARRGERDEAFIEQAAQIVVEEVSTLERRVRAFTQFASEPPVRLEELDVNSLLEERIALLRAAHPEVTYKCEPQPEPVRARADGDLVKGVLTNLLENAAHAAGAGGTVRGRVVAQNGKVAIEVEDSGPGLSAQARSTLFEPTISFKKAGMGLGLSIAKRSALLLGGDLVLMDGGELGGAAFRVLLPRAEDHAGSASTGC